MSSPDQVSYGRAARLRVAMGALAVELSETASSLVGTYNDDPRLGALAGHAASVVRDARELLRFAVAYERQRGTSWEALAGWPDLDGAEGAYGGAVRQLDHMLTECWLLGDDTRFPGAPDGVADTAETAGRLDRWVSDRMNHGSLAPDDADHLFPVSGHLDPLDTAEHSSFLAAAEVLIAERGRRYGPDDPSVRRMELGLARRRVELYERMFADGAAWKGAGESPAGRQRAPERCTVPAG